jgi:hypothetical protein
VGEADPTRGREVFGAARRPSGGPRTGSTIGSTDKALGENQDPTPRPEAACATQRARLGPDDPSTLATAAGMARIHGADHGCTLIAENDVASPLGTAGHPERALAIT